VSEEFALGLLSQRLDRYERRVSIVEEEMDDVKALRREVSLLAEGVSRLTTAVYASAGSLIVAVIAAVLLGPKL
jgi:hypothetical protein